MPKSLKPSRDELKLEIDVVTRDIHLDSGPQLRQLVRMLCEAYETELSHLKQVAESVEILQDYGHVVKPVKS